MEHMKDCFKPHRNMEAETQLKTMIQKIESLMYESQNDAIIENLLKEASKLVKAPDRVLDLTVIEHYGGWTDLDGLVGELTMEVPKLDGISKEDFLSIVRWIRAVIKNEQKMDPIRLDYWMDFYSTFFELNFPNRKEVDLFNKIFEETPLDELVNIAFPDE